MVCIVHWGFEWRWVCDWGQVRGICDAACQGLLELAYDIGETVTLGDISPRAPRVRHCVCQQ